MRIEGSVVVAAPRRAVWDALQDPAVLARTLPGCDAFVEVGPDAYRATITAGIASIKGTYLGDVSLSERVAPERYRLRASGSGAPGTVSADALVTLEDVDGATRITYAADAVVGGMIGGVGQRMITGVAKRMAAQFFAAVERDITGGGAVAAVATSGGRLAGATVEAPAVSRVPTDAGVRPMASAPRGASDILLAALAGGLLVLIGVLAGAWLG
jgi:uncharacterized protein